MVLKNCILNIRLCKCNLLVALIFICCYFTSHSSASVCNTYHYNADDCGVIEETPGDTRTRIPWTAGIFLHNEGERNYTFHATGTIIGSTTVLAVFPGNLEKLPRKIRGKHSSNNNPENFIIAVGLNSGNLDHSDRHTQLSQITFIEPYLGQEEQSREYHFVLLHLKTPLDFSTPYVRPICLSHFKLGRKVNDSSESFLHGGFAKRKIKGQHEKDWEVELKLQMILTGTGYECVKTFEKYYNKHFPAGMFCSQIPNSIDNHQVQTDSSAFPCLLQGSSVIQKIGQQWYLAGVTAFIRGRKAGICKSDAIYFNSRLSTALEWIERSLRCSPFSFSCSDGTCISLEQVCNSVRNCLDNGLDENEILCETNRKCDSGSNGKPNHQCNLVGGCISNEQVCDGHRHCFQGTDENPSLCNKDQGSRSSRDLSPNVIQYCLPLPETEGVQIEYISINKNGMANCTFIPVSTFALSKCRTFYKSKHLYSHLEQQCNDNGKWSVKTKFECEPDCGMLNYKPSLVDVGHSDISLPWHALLFNLDQDTQTIQFVCGATLIERQYLVTAGHCFPSQSSLKSYKVVLAPASKNFTENLIHDTPAIFEIDAVWKPQGFDMKSLEADIALIKLKHIVHFGAQIRPACYLWEEDEDSDNNNAGTTPISAWNRGSIAISGLHVANFPNTVDIACLHTSDLKCVGHQFGSPVRQIDTGGGLVSSMITKFGTRYVLRGVMSQEESFNSEMISQFTSLERYHDWISNIISR